MDFDLPQITPDGAKLQESKLIIQVRGTSGSGKSTVVRQVMEELGGFSPVKVGNRRQPLYYERGGLLILGHYETPCGGCDTIGSARQWAELIDHLEFDHVICEGLLLSEDTKWSSRLGDLLRVIFLTTDVDECIRRIKGRREAAGNEKPLKEDNTRNRVATIERARVKLRAAGIYCRRASSEQAPKLILKWLKELGCLS